MIETIASNLKKSGWNQKAIRILQMSSSDNAESTKQLLAKIGNADFYYVLQDNEFFESYINLGIQAWNTGNFSKRERELIILKIGFELNNHYIYKHHQTIALNNGVQIFELGFVETGVSTNNVREDAILDTVMAVINKESVCEDILNKDEIQSLICIVGFYSWVDYYTRTLDLDIGQREW